MQSLKDDFCFAPDVPLSKKIRLPLIALLLDFTPVLFIALASLGTALSGVFLLGVILSPVAGMIVGAAALVQGRGQIGTAGVIIAGIAVALPIVFVATVMLLFTTGAIAFGM